MKKITALLLCLFIIVLSVLPCGAAMITPSEKEYFPDGSYITVTMDDEIREENEMSFFTRLMEFFRKLIEFFKGSRTVSKTKYINYYSSQGDLLWSARLKADFVCTKNSAVCSDARFGIDIFDSDWELISSECTKENNLASADFTVRQYKLLVPLKTIERKITMTCDTNGNIV